MTSSPHKIVRFCLALTALIAVSACQTTTNYTGRANVPVLVMGEDEDLSTAPRSSDMFKRVIAEMNAGMARQGFRVVDEESVAVDLGWRMRDRRPKYELIQAVKLMNGSGSATHRVRAFTLFRIHNQVQLMDFATKITTRIDGEIYDAVTNQFLGTYELPPRVASGPVDCTSQACIDDVAGTGARELAANLSEVLGQKLGHLVDRKVSSGDFSDSTKKKTNTFGGKVTYDLTLKGFKTFEALEIIGVMTEDFPGYAAHDLIVKEKTVRRYEYVTKANAAKLEKWMNILLRDMGFDTDLNVAITLRDNRLFVEHLKPGQTPSNSTNIGGSNSSGRFN